MSPVVSGSCASSERRASPADFGGIASAQFRFAHRIGADASRDGWAAPRVAESSIKARFCQGRPWAALGTALGAAPLRRPPVVRRRAVHYEKARKFRKARRFCPETILMPTSLIDSAVFRDIFSTEAM